MTERNPEKPPDADAPNARLPHQFDPLFPELALFRDEESQKKAWTASQWVLLKSWKMWAVMALLLAVMLPAGFGARRWLLPYLPGGFGLQSPVVGGIMGGLCGVLAVFVGYRVVAGEIRLALRQRLRELGVRVCGRCGYDLRGLPADRCPECGAVDADAA